MKADIASLRTFNEKVARLEGTSLARRLDAHQLEVISRMSETSSLTREPDGSYSLVGRISSELEGFDQEQIDAFVLTYRFFIQKNERISIRALAKIYQAEWMPAEAAAPFTEARAEVNGFLRSPTSLIVAGEVITVEHLVHTVIYGGLAHADVKNEQEFKSWVADGGLTGFVWAEFLAALRRMMHYIRYFRDLNNAVIGNCGP